QCSSHEPQSRTGESGAGADGFGNGPVDPGPRTPAKGCDSLRRPTLNQKRRRARKIPHTPPPFFNTPRSPQRKRGKSSPTLAAGSEAEDCPLALRGITCSAVAV